MQRIIILTTLTLLSICAMANIRYDDGIFSYYLNTDSKKASIVSHTPKYSGDLSIPSTIEYEGEVYSVTSIGSAFNGCTDLTSIEIPEGVTSIGNYAFRGCTSLTSIEIPSSVTSIGDDAFRGCTSLTSIGMANSVSYIGAKAFAETAWYEKQPEGLVYVGNVAYEYKGTMPDNTAIVLQERTSGIAPSAFYGCTGLTSIEIPEGVTSIGSYTFSGCTGLTSIEIPEGVTSIGTGAFFGCTGLTSIEIPSSVTSIGNFAFSGCTGLTSIEIPEGVTSIGYDAFNGCTGLTSIEIPEGVTSIGSYTFSGCTGLTSFEIPSSVTSIGTYAFDHCTGLSKVFISDIGKYASTNYGNYEANPLTYAHHLYLNGKEVFDIVLPDGLTSIGSYTFAYCRNITSIEIPGSVTSIGIGAFDGCTGLTSIKVMGKRPATTSGGFAKDVYDTCTLYVPEGSENAYYVADGWKLFKTILTYNDGGGRLWQDVNGDGKVDSQDVIEIYKYMQEH